MAKFIVFNTPKQAYHWMKRKNSLLKQHTDRYDSESFDYYTVGIKNQVINVSGWACGCGCGQGSTFATVVGRIKRA
jgi:hypothetical protein